MSIRYKRERKKSEKGVRFGGTENITTCQNASARRDPKPVAASFFKIEWRRFVCVHQDRSLQDHIACMSVV